MFYVLWIPLLIISVAALSYLSYRNNVDGGKWLWIMYAFQLIPGVWILVSRFSKNLMFDGVLYDVIMLMAYSVCLGFFTGQFEKFTLTNWVGFILICIGFILLKVK